MRKKRSFGFRLQKVVRFAVVVGAFVLVIIPLDISSWLSAMFGV